MNVIIVDRKPLCRIGVKLLIDKELPFIIVKECSGLIELNDCLIDIKDSLKIVMIDFEIILKNGFLVIEEIKNRYSNMKIILYGDEKIVSDNELKREINDTDYWCKSEDYSKLLAYMMD